MLDTKLLATANNYQYGADMIDLKLFCAKYSDSKEPHPLSEPWTCNGNTYACDGHMIIRVDARSDCRSGLPEILEKSDGFKKLRWMQPGQEITHFPLYDPQKRKRCTFCQGTGMATICPECDGEGVVELSNGYHEYEWECKTCDGDGLSACYAGDGEICPRCNGTKLIVVDPFEYVDIGDCRIGKNLLDKIKDLPGIFLGPTVGVKNEQVPFVFDGGDGILMCMSK